MGGAGGSEARDQKPWLLLLYTEVRRAAELLQRLPAAKYQILSCPWSALTDGPVGELDPDLILLDPPADEKKLLESCQAARAQTERPIVVLSERHDERLVARALATGIDEYLVEPIGDRELVARIEAILRRMHRYAGSNDLQEVGGLVLSHADHSVELRGRKVFLSPIEFRLLACLASAPGHVLTHQTLMSRVWGAEYVDSRHYLRVYIRYLREKLEEDPTTPQLIVSEWGVGYRLEVADSAPQRRETTLPASRRAALPRPV